MEQQAYIENLDYKGIDPSFIEGNIRWINKSIQNPDSDAINVLIYESAEDFGDDKASTTYFARKLIGEKDFNFFVYGGFNADLAKGMDVVAMRRNLPDDHDIYRNFLDKLQAYDDGTRLFINPPESQRYFSNKKYLEDFLNLGVLPETKISADSKELVYFAKSLGDFIVKPCEGYGGKGIEIFKGKQDFGKLEEILHNKIVGERGEIIVQKLIPNVSEVGDKGIHMLGDEPIGAALRFPTKEGGLCNVSSGGSAYKTEITKENYKLIEKIKPIIQEKNLYWSRVDILGKYLGEINAVSPGLVVPTDKLEGNFYGKGVMQKYIEGIRERVNKIRGKS